MKTSLLERLARTTAIMAIAGLLALAAQTSMAAEFDDGWKAYEAGDFATALKIWNELAAKGDARAQFNIGVL